MIRTRFVLSFFALLFAVPFAQARPEYALKQATQCASCHMNPWGGGPKTVYGKMYGTRTFGTNKLTMNDMLNANLRVIGYEPKKPTQNSNGVALMEASVSGSAAIIEASETSGELRGVFTYNAAPLGAGPREAYARWKMAASSDPLPTYVVVGRTNMPFGLLTDEHRTYVRQQSNMTLNNFSTGIAVSGGLVLTGLTYDLALVNDFQSGGLFTSKDLTWAAVFNVRYMPPFAPVFVGASQSYERTLIQPMPYGTSIYAGLSLDRLTQSKVNGSILVENVIATNWDSGTLNPAMGGFFVPSSDAAYQTALARSQSRGWMAQFKYDLSSRWSFFYKYDYLALDSRFPSDAFGRHGLGVEMFINSNIILNTRVERAFVGRPELIGNTELAAQDDLIAMLRVWL